MTDASHGVGPYRSGLEPRTRRLPWGYWPPLIARLLCALLGHYWFSLRSENTDTKGTWCYRCGREEWKKTGGAA